MRTFLIAIGNVLRRDDGVAHRALELMGGTRSVLQLTPEIAPEIAPYDLVVFLDASAYPGESRIEPVTADAAAGPFAHSLTPAQVVQLAEQLYGFGGAAFLCRIPGVDFGVGEVLSPTAEANAAAAASLLRQALD